MLGPCPDLAVSPARTTARLRSPSPRHPPLASGPRPSRSPRRSPTSARAPVGQPTKVEISVRLVVPRPVLERLTARGIREGRKLEALMQEILEDGAAR